MVLKLDAQLESALADRAHELGIAPESLAMNLLRDQLVPTSCPQGEEWVRRLRGVATDCGVSLSDVAVSSEGIYD